MMKWITVLIVLAAMANCSFQESCETSAPEIVLRELHSGCNHNQKSRNPDCVAAMHRFCNRVTYPPTLAGEKIGISREHRDLRIGMSCLRAHWSGDVSIGELRRHHSWCSLQKSQHRDCLAAIHRYCAARFGRDFAGISQEVGNGVLGVRCFRSTRKESVRADVLRSHHHLCTYPNSDSDNCFAAASRWCSSLDHSGGITQEVGNNRMTVACYNAEFSNDVFVKRTSDFHAAQRRVNICNVGFAINQARVLQSRPEILLVKMYDNLGSSVALTGTFALSRTVTETNSFTHQHQVTLGTSATVSVGLPYVSAGVTVSASSSRSVSLTRENSNTVFYNYHSSVNVPPGHAIVKKATITVATLSVPWSGRVVNGLGAVKPIGGQWTGTNTYNLTVVQWRTCTACS